MAGTGHSADAADDLNYELDRATLVVDEALPRDIVRMGSRITYRQDGGARRVVTLVYPDDANPDAGRISILSPVGTALLGLRAGQSLHWRFRDGSTQELTVLSVADGRTRDELQ